MGLLLWAHLFLHGDNVAVLAVLGVWEGPTPPASTSNWHSVTQISSLELVRAATMLRDEDKEHGVKKHVGLFQERYNGKYTQAHGH